MNREKYRRTYQKSFLEFLIEKLSGREAWKIRGEGCSHWYCPRCQSRSFHTLPEVPEYKHRAQCDKCKFFGDAADVLKLYRPKMTNYADRQWKLEKLEDEYERRCMGLKAR